MYPVTPSADWNTVPSNRRRIATVSPEEDENVSAPRSASALRSDNPFVILDDSDDESIASVTVRSVAEGGILNYSNDGSVTTLQDIQASFRASETDHRIHSVETTAAGYRYVQSVLDPGATENTVIIRNTAYINHILGRQQYQDQQHRQTRFETASSATPLSLPALHTPDDDDTASTSSLSTMLTLPSIDDHLKKEYQSAENSSYNFADAVVFREELGNALAGCQHVTRDAGHSYMVDTQKRHNERYGSDTAVPMPPIAQRVELPAGNSSGEWKRYEVMKKIYEMENHLNADALRAIVRRFPDTMKEQKNDYGSLPLNYTARQALNFIESKVSDRVKKQKAYIDLMGSITARPYVPSSEGPVVYLKQMEHDKHCIDILSGSSATEFEYSWETLIINCQTKIRSSGKHNNTYLRLIEDKWEVDFLHKQAKGRWERFKILYIKELQKLTEDGIDNTALHAQQALIARVDAMDSKYQSDVQTLCNNQLTLETAFHASGVPSVVDTDGTGTVSGSIAGTAASGFPPSALADILREMKALKCEVTSLSGRNPPPPPLPRTRTGTGANASSDRLKEWRQWVHWCYSCGCNLNHDSKDCKRNRKKDHKDAATMQNPMGGNVKRDALWNKWWNPATYMPHDKPE